jgi:hypothetical protein
MEIIITETNLPYKDLSWTTEVLSCRGEDGQPEYSICSSNVSGKIILTFQSHGDFSEFINKNGDVKRKKLAKHILSKIPKRISL